MRVPLIVLALAAVLAAGCGSDDDSAATATTATAAAAAATTAPAPDTSTAAVPAAALPDGLAGAWKRDVTTADIERNAANKGTGAGEEPIPPASTC